MARASKLFTEEIVKQAQKGLETLGQNGMIALKLKAIISAKKHGLTTVADVFGTTKATLISWIKRMDESLEQLNIQPGRGRKSVLSLEEEMTVKDWLSLNSQLTIDQVKIKIEEEMGKYIGRSTVHRLMKKLCFSYITPRPKHHKQDAEMLQEAKKNLEKTLQENPSKRIFLWMRHALEHIQSCAMDGFLRGPEVVSVLNWNSKTFMFIVQ